MRRPREGASVLKSRSILMVGRVPDSRAALVLDQRVLIKVLTHECISKET